MLAADAEEVALSFENTNQSSTGPIKTDLIRHPIALFFHLAFRTAAVLLYLFGTLFFNSFITIFVIIIICLSMDFWTVKNISGRLLVGLRWWNNVSEDGKSNWIFENRKNSQNDRNMNRIVIESTLETNVFWLSLIVADLVWAAFFLISLFTLSFKWMTIIIVAIMLNASNTYGFLKCRFGSETDMKSAATSFFGTRLLKSMFERSNTAAPQQASP